MHWLDEVDEHIEDTEAAGEGQPPLLVRANEAVSKELMRTLMQHEDAGTCEEEDVGAPEAGDDSDDTPALAADGDEGPAVPSSADVAAAAESLCAEAVAAEMRAQRYSVQSSDARSGPAFQRAQDLGRQKALISAGTLSARGVDIDVRITPLHYSETFSARVKHT
jgi:hypothetical protein